MYINYKSEKQTKGLVTPGPGPEDFTVLDVFQALKSVIHLRYYLGGLGSISCPVYLSCIPTVLWTSVVAAIPVQLQQKTRTTPSPPLTSP